MSPDLTTNNVSDHLGKASMFYARPLLPNKPPKKVKGKPKKMSRPCSRMVMKFAKV